MLGVVFLLKIINGDIDSVELIVNIRVFVPIKFNNCESNFLNYKIC